LYPFFSEKEGLRPPTLILPLLWRGRIKVGEEENTYSFFLPLLWRGRIKVGEKSNSFNNYILT